MGEPLILGGGAVMDTRGLDQPMDSSGEPLPPGVRLPPAPIPDVSPDTGLQ